MMRVLLSFLLLAAVVAAACVFARARAQSPARTPSVPSAAASAATAVPGALAPGAWSQPGTVVTQAEAIARHRLQERLMSYGSDYFRADPAARVRVVEGDLAIGGPLRLDWDGDIGADGLVVTGDLVVDGAIVNASMNGGPFLLVEGRTRARAIVGGGAELRFQGDAQVDEVVIGHYNDGVLVFGSDLAVPALVRMDHFLDVRGTLHGRTFDLFDGDDRWPDLADPAVPGIDGDDEWAVLDEVVIPRLLRGEALVRDGLRAHATPSHDRGR